MHATEHVRESLLPEGMHRASLLWWLWILPQALLGLINLRDFFLVNGEMTLPQITLAGYVASAEFGLLAFGCASLLAQRLRNRPLSLPLCGAILLSHAAYLWGFTACLNDLLPSSVTMWLLPLPRVLYAQFALIMPILFYSLLRLSSYAVPWSRRQDLWLMLSAMTGPLLLWAGAISPWHPRNAFIAVALWDVALTIILLPLLLAARAALHDRRRGALTAVATLTWLVLVGISFVRATPSWRWSDGNEWGIIAAVVLLTVAFMLHLLRLLVRIEAWLADRGPVGRTLVAALVAVVGPFGGLMLNRHIPFPADYQCLSVYILAVVNAALLMLPASRSRARALATWLLQALMFPFTFYFFIVFLPFLPLALLAIVAAGAGFLVLTPTALFLFHGRRMLEGLRLAQLAWGPRRARLALAGALAALPLALTAAALVDRAGLRQAMDYVFEPTYEAATFHGSRALVRRTLLRMVDARDDRRLPILSGIYNHIVFGGLVLPDAKLKQMQDVFFGGPLPGGTKPGVLAEVFGEPQRGVLDDITGGPDSLRDFAGPSATLADLASHSDAVRGGVRTQLTLTLTNTHSAPAECVTRLHLPDSVLVSGLWLSIDGERVAGQLFEKQAALWVYRMITSSRRDPALLAYTGPQSAELRVFPVEPHQTRTVDIELLHPRGYAATIFVDARPVTLPALGTASAPAFTTAGDGTGTFLILGRELPSVVRQPYLHLIVDQSAAATGTASVADRVRAAAAQFPGLATGVVTLANYEFAEPAGTVPRPLSEIADILEQDADEALPPRGGFCRDRAIQRALTQRAALLDSPATPDAERLRAPVFVVLPSVGSVVAGDPDRLAWWQDLAPDFPFFYEWQANRLELRSFAGPSHPGGARPPELAPVTLVRSDSQFAALPPAVDVWHVDRVEENIAPTWRIYRPDTGRFTPWPALSRFSSGAYRRGLDVLAESRRLQHHPEETPTRWPEVVRASKTAGVLAPATAWMVVENSAQWKMLARKESEKLAHAEALSFRTVPDAPGTFALTALGLLALGVVQARLRKAGVP
ncbi:MAG: MSEP-CTERM sorting domain-containing protein [Lentisphaerae bacterium]|nr:MSEP-CTERM sorting domain-containing protein [Lentisphaerota bacterium]